MDAGEEEVEGAGIVRSQPSNQLDLACNQIILNLHWRIRSNIGCDGVDRVMLHVSAIADLGTDFETGLVRNVMRVAAKADRVVVLNGHVRIHLD